MCGIAFAVAPRPVDKFIGYANDVQTHRGPDAVESHFEQVSEYHLGLGHRRLAIVDLSEAGIQPMHSASGRMTMIFNGEIYNFVELAEQFGLPRRTGTDTEVALELIERLGIAEASRHFNGMWAIAVFDRQSDRLYLSRDRFGKKPLNYLVKDGGIYGASELKAFAGVENFQRRPDLVTAGRFLVQSLQNIDERTWLEGVSALPAASTGFIDVASPERGVQDVRSYWSLQPDGELASRSLGEAADQLRGLLTDSVSIRCRADVPVGVALSGGLDSSILASITRNFTGADQRPIGLFSVVHPGEEQDESRFVELLARAKGLDVQTFSLSLEEEGGLDKLVRKTSHQNDAPVPSFAPALFQALMGKARQAGFKVVLTGQGGDEAFCGYRKYPLWYGRHLLRRNPLAGARFLLPFVLRGTLLPQLKWREAKRYVTSGNLSVLGEAAKKVFAPQPLGRGMASLSELQIADVERFSVPYLCHYEDRMSMACSVEVRSPFLDYRVVTMGVSLPPQLKMGTGWSKYILRKAFARDLPSEIAWRKDKMGFSNPEDLWLRRAGPAVREQMRDPQAPIYELGIVDRNAYLKQLDCYFAGDRSIWFREVFAPYSLNAWLTSLQR